MTIKTLPWLDRTGRLSWLKLVTFVLLFVPGLWIALQLDLGWLQPKPVTEAIHQSGTWAVRFLLISLAITPLRRLAQWNKLIAIRRMLGLAVLAYAALHFTLYIVDQNYDLVHVATEIVLRFYLTIGFVALVGFMILGATSTDGMIRRIGAKRWNRLHQIVYLLGVLGLLHFFLQAKLNITQPVLMAGLFLLLMGYRLLQKRGWADHVVALLALAVGAAFGTAVLEAAWYQIVNNRPFNLVLSANLDFDSPLRSSWWILAVGLVVVLVRVTRPLWVKYTSGAKQPSRREPRATVARSI
ncbi:sulfoxide reductase heme-binding subunit YedZ [Lichenihabitans sp. PAMC28606]|uniref:sulfite oxidase heme-binding subunit YedZ n=1 Tax=Lichenihabitans sp. PAMC28606 TaxID=2880932 RepID=UPI001D0A7043|nr:protein-methionine-sulfoxide reductase heme-binding subunit MsrQ [Lichenihabitans sp. PAMC28606]UDL94634.1 sulfoxide reductase heme-binding subunit YedZ [Lichenihabitans sp. PAMC28606]